MTNSELIALSLRDAAAALADGRATSAALCGAFLERIQAVEPKVKALLGVNPDSVMAQALASDSRRAAGAPLSEFDGIPITLKDKIGAGSDNAQESFASPAVMPTDNGAVGEAVAALTVLGYGSNEIAQVLKSTDTAGMSTEQIIKAVLKQMVK